MKRRVTLIFLSIFLALAGVNAALSQGQLQIIAPVYGNWCGPQHPVDMSRAAPPVNLLDAACMRHDYCIAAQGQLNCGCDISFLQELRATRWPSPIMHSNARALYDAIALVPCDTPDGTSYKQTLFAVDLFNDLISGNGQPMDVLERWRLLLLGQ